MSKLNVCFNEKDMSILRNLGLRLRELAESPKNILKRNLWYQHNALKQGKPLILATPENAWREIITDKVLQCEDKLARAWENDLRIKIYTADTIKDDSAVEPWFNINWSVNEGNFGVEAVKTYGANHGSYVWEAPIKDLRRDLCKLKFREPSVDRELTQDKLQLAKEVFGDVLPVRIRGEFWWTNGLTARAIELIGLENLMLYMYDDPDNLHFLMAWLRDEHLNFINWLENQGLLTDNNEDDSVGSGGLGYSKQLPILDRKPGGPAKLKDIWSLSESQETVGVSPTMFGEFVFPYQLPILEKFGLTCYGCCEPIEKRWQYISKIPNLRRVSVSPWADQKAASDQIGKNYIYSRKPNPSPISVSFNEDVIRKDLRDTLEATKDNIVEIILKDTNTVEHQPGRIAKWVEIAREEMEKYYK